MFRIQSAAVSIVCMIHSLVAIGAAPAVKTSFDWRSWEALPIQTGGRQKPLDTMTRETLRLTANRSSLLDPETGQRLSPTAGYLSMLFDWTGWDHEQRNSLLMSMDWTPQYSYLHHTDKWDRAPLLRIDHLRLKKMLGFADEMKYATPAALATATIIDPRTRQSMSFTTWGYQLQESQESGKSLTELEQKGLELAQRLQVYYEQRMGMNLKILPVRDGIDGQWMSVGSLMLTSFDDATDPSGEYRHVRSLLWNARSAFRSGDAPKFNQATAELRNLLRELGPASGAYPGGFKISLEVAYNHWAPFRYAWLLMLLAVIGMLLHLGSGWRSFYWSAIVAYGLGLVAIVIGFTMRVTISGRPPVTNMYESVVYVGSGVAMFGAVFECLYRRKYVLTAAAIIATIALILADNCPTILDPSLRPLEPVLRSNFWLVTHVMTIALSYAAFALALGIANITLGYYLVRSSNDNTIRALSQFTYRAIQVGVLLLAAGIILGGVWADYSWGRFWGWDPKEVWALVALLGYVAVLHARFAGLVGHRGLAALSVVCFSLVIMAWYGVNFVLGAGLHSYGFGGGGQGVVYTAVFLQWLYVVAAIRRSRPDIAHENPVSREWSASANQRVSTAGVTAGPSGT